MPNSTPFEDVRVSPYLAGPTSDSPATPPLHRSWLEALPRTIMRRCRPIYGRGDQSKPWLRRMAGWSQLACGSRKSTRGGARLVPSGVA